MTYDVLFAAFLVVLPLGYAWPKVSGWRDRRRRLGVLERRAAAMTRQLADEFDYDIRVLRRCDKARAAGKTRTGHEYRLDVELEGKFGTLKLRELKWAVGLADAGDYMAELLLDDGLRICERDYLVLRWLAPCWRCRCWGEYCGHGEEARA